MLHAFASCNAELDAACMQETANICLVCGFACSGLMLKALPLLAVSPVKNLRAVCSLVSSALAFFVALCCLDSLPPRLVCAVPVGMARLVCSSSLTPRLLPPTGSLRTRPLAQRLQALQALALTFEEALSHHRHSDAADLYVDGHHECCFQG